MERDILQVSATIIAGAFIFLTLSAFLIDEETIIADRSQSLATLILGFGVIAFFSLACLATIQGWKRTAKFGFVSGFAFLLFISVSFVAANMYYNSEYANPPVNQSQLLNATNQSK